jgi:hypothetical protein
MQNLGTAYTNQAKYGQAEAMLRECLALREKVTPVSWERYSAMSLLGDVFLRQARFGEAEKLLLDGYSGMIERYSQISANNRPSVARAGERVVDLYVKLGNAQRAAEWRTRVEREATRGQ